MKIQIIVGSVRKGRTAIKIAHWIERNLTSHKLSTVELEIVDLKEWDLPIFSGENAPVMGIYDQPKQQAWADKIAQGDAFIFISPEYNHGYSPALKNSIDYLSKEWKGKPAAYISYGTTNGSRSVDQIRLVGTSVGLIDSNAVLEIRDIFNRSESDEFISNEAEDQALETILNKLIQNSKS